MARNIFMLYFITEEGFKGKVRPWLSSRLSLLETDWSVSAFKPEILEVKKVQTTEKRSANNKWLSSYITCVSQYIKICVRIFSFSSLEEAIREFIHPWSQAESWKNNVICKLRHDLRQLLDRRVDASRTWSEITILAISAEKEKEKKKYRSSKKKTKNILLSHGDLPRSSC